MSQPAAGDTPVVEPAWRRIGAAVVILLASATSGISFGVVGPVLRPIAAQIGDERISQIIIVMPLAGLALGGLVGGWIAEWLRARRAICVGGLAFALAGAAALAPPSAPGLLTICFCIGFAAAIIGIGRGLLLAELYAGDARARMIGFASAFGSLLAAGSVWLSGVIADQAGWQSAFLQFTAVGAIIVVCVLVAVRGGAGSQERGARTDYRLLAPVLPIFLAGGLLMLVLTTTNTHIPLLLAEQGITSTAETSSVMSMQGLFSMLAALGYGALQARLGKVGVAAIGIVLLAVGNGLAAVAETPLAFGAACAFLGMACGAIVPCLIDLLLGLAAPAVRARALGFYAAAFNVGGFLNPFIMRPIRDAVGLQGLYMVIAVSCAVIGGAYVLGGAARARRAALARTAH
ncbi:MFS transporter [Phenylobacterium sp.]|jgi:MFS family permease|uniref:MFS transporter n=1 Tax=Phenylobacterium sp. TaxID=1871053 RepID=UPI002F402BE4